MALQVFDGLDDYGTTNQEAFLSKWVTYTSVGGQVAGAFSGYGVGINMADIGLGGVALTALPNPGSSMVVGGRLYNTAYSSYLYGCLCLTNSTSDISGTATLALHISLSGPSPILSVVNSAGTVLGTATVLMNTNTWTEFEMMAAISTGSGSVTVKMNGTTVISLTGVNTQGSSASSSIGAAGFGTNFVEYLGLQTYWDDFYVCDTTGSAPANTFLSTVAGAMGPRIYTLFPNADSSTAWTPLSGSSNFAMVDEQSFDGDTSYIYSSTASQQDLYGVPAAAGVSGILAVKTSYVARMDDAGTREVAGSIQSGGTVYQGATTAMTSNYQKVDDYYLVDPATSSAWSPAKFTTSGNVFIGVECVE